MKKLAFTFLTLILVCTSSVFAKTDRYSEDYLKNTKHFSIMNPLLETIVEKSIIKSLKKETDSEFQVDFSGYTLGSMKKGIFKNLDLQGNNVKINGIPVPYLRVKTLTDYNYIDYTQNPIKYKSPMKFAYEIQLSEDSINAALLNEEYKSVIENISKLAYPMFQVYGVSSKIVNNRFYMLIEYNFPLATSSKNKVFVASCDFRVVDGKIKSDNISLNSAYGNISLNKVANLLNFLNPLQFTLSVIEKKDCNANIENVKIIDNKVKINGKIFVEGE